MLGGHRMCRVVKAAGAAAPTITSLNYDQGDTAGGGQDIIITGSGFTGATAVTFLGTAATGYTVDSATQITATLPAHAAGTGNVEVTTPGGSDTIAFEYWSPAEETGVRLYDAESGITESGGSVTAWADRGAASQDLAVPGSGFEPAYTANAFGSLHGLTFTPDDRLDLASKETLASGRHCFAVAKWTSTDTTPTTAGLTPLTVLGDQSGTVYGTFGFSGEDLLEVGYDDGTAAWEPTSTTAAGLNDGAPHLVGVTHTHNDCKLYADSTTPAATSSNAYYNTSFNGWTCIGGGYGGDYLDATLGAVVVWYSGTPTGTQLTKQLAWARQRFGTP